MDQTDVRMIKEKLTGLLEWIKATTDRMDAFYAKLDELDTRLSVVEEKTENVHIR